MKFSPRLIYSTIASSIFLIATTIILCSYTSTRSETNEKLVIQTYEVINTSKDLRKATLEAELAIKDFVIIKDSTILEPFKSTIALTNLLVAKLKKLTAEIPSQQLRLDTLKALFNKRSANDSQQILAITENKATKKSQLTASGDGKKITDQIHILITRFITEEQELAIYYEKEAARWNHSTFLTLIIGRSGVLLTLGFLIVLFYIENKDRKSDLHELFLKSEWLAKIMSKLGDGLMATDPHGIITMVNPSAALITGWEQDQALGSHIDKIFEITDEVTGLKVINPAIEAMQENKVIPLANHTFLKQKDGNKIYIEDSGTPISNETGEIIGAVLIFRDVSDKKRAKDELHDLNASLEKRVEARTLEVMESEKRISTSLDNMMEGVQILDFNYRFQYVNDALAKQIKFSKKDLLGYTMMEKYPGIENTQFFKAIQACMTNRIFDQIDFKYTFQDESTSWFEVNIQPVPEGVLIRSLDVTERKKAEEYFHKSEIFSSSVLASISSHIAVIDADGNILSTNKAWDDFAKENGETRLARVSKGSNYFDVCKKSILSGDPYAERALEGINSIFNKDRILFELEYPCDGPIIDRWFMLSVSLFGEEENKVLITHLDITERKKTQEKIRESEEKFRALVENAPDVIMTIDLENNIQFVNHIVSGIPKDQVIGTSVYSFVDPPYIELVKQTLKKVVTTKKVLSYETSGSVANGSIGWYLTHAGPIFNGNNVVGITLLVKDISDRKQAEQTLQLQNTELRKTNSELDRFVYSTSHDLRAPLTSLLGLINILDENMLPTEFDQKELIEMMKLSITKLDNFIEDIINYSRNSRMEVEKDEINFKELINESRQSLKYMKGDSGLKINVEVDQIGKFISDRMRILVNMNNLISNAIKYHDKTKPNPHVNITVHSDALKAIVTVEDNGIGIADDKQEKIFDMFYRATKLSKGSGLGMYIAKETQRKLNGTITVASKLDKGTTFTVIIPNLIETNSIT